MVTRPKVKLERGWRTMRAGGNPLVIIKLDSFANVKFTDTRKTIISNQLLE